MISKSWAIKLATEAARTVLSVDQIIVARQAGGPKPPGPNAVSHRSGLSPRISMLTLSRTGMRIRRWMNRCVELELLICIIPMSTLNTYFLFLLPKSRLLQVRSILAKPEIVVVNIK